ncbi:MAG TPA: helix-turn-helix domain-containing protein [Candidatus Nitrosotalea sp.]|nr:helix-turn-helix domain-containing protein [Candidatus Nitrosotalea sp.]
MKVEGGLLVDDKVSLILIATNYSRSACEVSKACNLPLSTTYRKLDVLLQHNLVKISGEIENGRRYSLYTNAHKNSRFKNSERALAFMNIVAKNPGIGFREIQRISGLTNGVVSHYLSQLQKRGLVRVRRDKRKIWIFPSDVPPDEMTLIVNLRNDTLRAIILHLLKLGSATFLEIARNMEKCAASVSVGLSRLAKEGVVKRTGGAHGRYFLMEPRRVARILARVCPVSEPPRSS